MPTVLLTRPHAESEKLATMLGRLGYNALVEPLLEIEPLSAPPPAGPFDAVMITSANALTGLEANEVPPELFGLPCFCVGPRTGERATHAGFRAVRSGDAGGLALAALIGKSLGGPSRVLHIAGRDSSGAACAALEEKGHKTAVWTVYAAKAVPELTPEARGLLRAEGIAAVLLFSPRTAAIFVDLLRAGGFEACCESLCAICLSDAVAAALETLSWRRRVAAAMPTEDAMIASLQQECPVR